MHCRPRNFTTFTKQNLSRCLSLKFLSAEMDKYILHIPSCQRPCLSLTEIGSLDYWPPSKEIDFIFLKADFLPVVYFGNHHTQWGQKNYEVEVSWHIFWINWIIGLPLRRSTSFFWKRIFFPLSTFVTTTFTLGPDALWICIPNSLTRYFFKLSWTTDGWWESVYWRVLPNTPNL